MTGRGWCKEVNRERMLLERIVALLVALAFLAEHAALASPHRRRAVVGILIEGEAAAREMIAALAGLPAQPDADGPLADPQVATAAVTASGSTEEALRLAAAFRVLALVLTALLEEARRAGALLSSISGAAMTAACGMAILSRQHTRVPPSFRLPKSLRVASPP